MSTLTFAAKLGRLFAHSKAILKHPLRYLTTLRPFGAATDRERWAEEENLSPLWDDRTILIASMIPAGASVIEFGAGRLTLPKHLKPGCSYQPVDLVPRSADTIAFDLNDYPYPKLPRRYDYAVFSGVLEYVGDLPRLMLWLRDVADNVVLSYAVTDHLSDPVTRRRNGWINGLANAEVLKLLERSGMRLLSQQRWQEQNIYVCSVGPRFTLASRGEEQE